MAKAKVQKPPKLNRKDLVQRLDWIEDRLEGLEGSVDGLDRNVNNHMATYKGNLDDLGKRFNILLALIMVVLAGLFSMATALIVVFVTRGSP